MPRNNKKLFLLLPIILTLFLIGLINLFLLRFETGDVYPAYSSLRSDPLGTKAFFESLVHLKSFKVKRNYHPLTRMDPVQDTTLFYLSASVHDMAFHSWESLRAFDRFAINGGRVVISFFPVKGRSRAKKRVSIEEHWGLRFKYDAKARSASLHPQSGPRGARLPGTLPWHTALYFSEIKKNWQVIYAHNGHPLIVERQLGRGTLVLCTDSYFFSNEALRRECYPPLLAWFVGGSEGAIFDESHFGIQESPGVAGLARRYGLQWFFFGILLLAGLFIWKNSVYFTPPPSYDPSLPEKDFTSARDHKEGLTSLLRRSISSRSILSVCLEEWKKTADLKKQGMYDRLEQIEKIVNSETSGPDKGGDPVGRYRAVCRILSKGKRS